MKSFLLPLFLVSSVLADLDVFWAGNQTFSDELKFRNINMSTLTLPSTLFTLSYESLEATTGNNMTGDGCFGAAYALPAGPPLNYLTHFSNASIWNASNNTKNPTSSANLTEAQSLIGASYLAVTELESNGTELGSVSLRTLDWNLSKVETNGPAKYANLIGTNPAHGNFSISLTFVTANTSGTLSNGAIVTPKSILTFINILNYNFTSPTSKLRLTLALITGSNSSILPIQEMNGSHHLSAGSGNATVYFDGSAQAFNDSQGAVETVMVNTSVGQIMDFEGAAIVQQAAAMRAAQPLLVVNYTLINITFPQAAFNLTYATSIGLGSFNASNSTLNQTVSGGNSGMSSGMSGSGMSSMSSGMSSGSSKMSSGMSSGMGSASSSGVSAGSSGISGGSSGISGGSSSGGSSGVSGGGSSGVSVSGGGSSGANSGANSGASSGASSGGSSGGSSGNIGMTGTTGGTTGGMTGGETGGETGMQTGPGAGGPLGPGSSGNVLGAPVFLSLLLLAGVLLVNL